MQCLVWNDELVLDMSNKTFIGFGFRMMARTIKAEVCVICEAEAQPHPIIGGLQPISRDTDNNGEMYKY